MLLAGAGAAVAILLGAPLLVAAAAGVAAWGVNVGLAVPRRREPARIDPFTLADPWRSYVVDAQVAKVRFDEVSDGMSRGPLRDRLLTLGQRLDDGVRESWQVASRGHDLSVALERLAPDRARRELAAAERELAEHGPSASTATVIAALRAQVDAAQRLERTAADARDRLRVLNARFDELVARAIEVSVGVGDERSLGGDVDELIHELEALRIALEETTAAEVARPDSPVVDVGTPRAGPNGAAGPV
jgi:hypothetical protein